jgi:hypothetical protein
LRPLLLYEGEGFIVHASFDFHPFEKKGFTDVDILITKDLLIKTTRPTILVEPYPNTYLTLAPRIQ